MQSLEQQPATSRKRKHTEHSDELRACIVRWRDAGMSWSQIQALSGVPDRTARHMVAVASAEGRTAKRHHGGAHHVVYGDDVRACVVSAQDRDAVLRLSDLRDEVQRERCSAGQRTGAAPEPRKVAATGLQNGEVRRRGQFGVSCGSWHS
jgi:DNA-binding transcriptional MerR regulator